MSTTKRIKMLQSRLVAGEHVEEGKVVERPIDEANMLIRLRFAEELSPESAAKGKDPDKDPDKDADKGRGAQK